MNYVNVTWLDGMLACATASASFLRGGKKIGMNRLEYVILVI